MTAHAAALVEKISTEIQRVSALRHAIFRMTLLAAGFGVLFLKQRPEPVLVTAMTLHFAGRRAAVAPMTTGTTKALRIVNLQQFFIRMTHKRPRQAVRLLAWTIRRQVRRLQIQRLTNTDMTNFTTIDDVSCINTDLMAQNRVVEIVHLPDQTIDLSRSQTDDVVLQIIVSLLRELGRLFQQLAFLASRLAFSSRRSL